MKSIIRIALLAFFTGSLFTSCDKFPIHLPPGGGGGGSNSSKEIIYVETNDSNQNAILAYVNNGDGQLQQLAGSPFITGGRGATSVFLNNSDNEVIISNDHKFLLAVNAGSNNITVFNIHSDGTLSPVPGSPFPSGGGVPSSMAQYQQYIYVANKSGFIEQNYHYPPNYVALRLGSDGSLTIVPGARADVTQGSPCNVLIARNNPFLFGAEFSNHISNYIINSNASLGYGPTPFVPAADVYGLCEHPVSNVLYAGFPQEAKTAVYDFIPETGALNFKTSIDGGAGASNMRSNSAGDRLYVLSSYQNAVTVVNTSNPDAPTVMNRLNLKNTGEWYHIHKGLYPNSQCYSLGLSTNEKFLYVACHNDVFFSDTTNSNWFHVLSVQSDGTLTEPGDPIQFPVEQHVMPRGVAVYKPN
jgi:6-phosphogluconolactonase (cycloisomerase 2 family)